MNITDYEKSIWDVTKKEAKENGYQLTVTTSRYRLWNSDGVKLFKKLVDIREFFRQEPEPEPIIGEQLPLM